MRGLFGLSAMGSNARDCIGERSPSQFVKIRDSGNQAPAGSLSNPNFSCWQFQTPVTATIACAGVRPSYPVLFVDEPQQDISADVGFTPTILKSDDDSILFDSASHAIENHNIVAIQKRKTHSLVAENSGPTWC